MKKILLLLLMLPPFISRAQDTVAFSQLPLDTANALYYYKTVGSAPNVKKAELYGRAKIWATFAFKSVKNVIQLDDPEGGNFIIKAISVNSKYNMNFSMRFTVKDEKYRLIISGFSFEIFPTSWSMGENSGIEEYINGLKSYNENVKSGNDAFNKTEGISKSKAKKTAAYVTAAWLFASSTSDEVKQSLIKPAKSDDF
jgi:hypothetical protein